MNYQKVKEKSSMKKLSVFQEGWVRTSPQERAPLKTDRLSPEDAELIGKYLADCKVIMRASSVIRDVFSTRENKIPLKVRTDGKYVWPETVTYYVTHYSVVPDREFIDYVKARNFDVRVPSETEITEALAVMKGSK